MNEPTCATCDEPTDEYLGDGIFGCSGCDTLYDAQGAALCSTGFCGNVRAQDDDLCATCAMYRDDYRRTFQGALRGGFIDEGLHEERKGER